MKLMTGLKDFSNAVRAAFTYDNGVLRWQIEPARCVAVGSVAGGKGKGGYIKIKWKGKMYQAHRLIFAYHHSWLPDEVDHINGDRADNRIENLRGATKNLNQHNAQRRSDNKSGVKGVHWCERDGRWVALIRRDNKIVFRGYFHNLPTAKLAVQKAREQAHGSFARHA
jgi:hypothetical protein